MNKKEGVALAETLARAIRPILAGHPPEVQGAVLADLLSMWLAGHIGPTQSATNKCRANLMTLHMRTVRELVELADTERRERMQ